MQLQHFPKATAGLGRVDDLHTKISSILIEVPGTHARH